MFPINPKITGFLWRLAAVMIVVFPIPAIVVLLVLAVVHVVTYRRVEPEGGWNLRQLGTGFVGWFVINTLLGVWILSGDWSGDPWGLVRGSILLLVNFVALLILVFRGGQTIFGVLSAMFVNAIGMLLFVDLEEFGSFTVLPFYLYFFYPSL